MTDDVRDTAGVTDETDSDAPETTTESEDSITETAQSLIDRGLVKQ